MVIDVVRVKGRQEAESLFYPLRKGADSAWVENFNRARERYVKGDFAGARDEFAKLECPFPKLAECYRIRCETFLRDAAPAGWDGIWKFTEK